MGDRIKLLKEIKKNNIQEERCVNDDDEYDILNEYDELFSTPFFNPIRVSILFSFY